MVRRYGKIASVNSFNRKEIVFHFDLTVSEKKEMGRRWRYTHKFIPFSPFQHQQRVLCCDDVCHFSYPKTEMKRNIH